MRTIIDLPDDQLAELALFCTKHGISRAEAIRRAVHKMLSEINNNSRREALGAVYGLWKHRTDIGDSMTYQARMDVE